jgi:NADH oxidase (H2O2-forming)
LNITVVEALPQILSTILDEDMSKPLHNMLSEKITLYTDHIVTKIQQQEKKDIKVILQNNNTKEQLDLKADIILLATGTMPETTLAVQVGCTIGSTGGIQVNATMETSIKNIYAVGDCTEYKDYITGQSLLTGLGSVGVRQGIAAGINAAGGNYILPKGVLNTSTSEFFTIEVASVGPTMQRLEKEDIVAGKFNGMSLPEYFPGGKPITIKVIVKKNTGQVLSAQAVGQNAALRINTIACAILNEMEVDMLRKLETAYAPPVAPTLDAITLACDVASMKQHRHKRLP